MGSKTKDIVEYLCVVISEFGKRFSMTNAAAYRYLKKYTGIDFLIRHYDTEHTFSVDNAVEDLCEICQRKGGTLSLSAIVPDPKKIVMTKKEVHDRDKKYLTQCLSRDIILLLMQHYGMSMEEAMDKLYTSHTYELIENENTGMYYQSAVYALTYLEEELHLQLQQ